MKSVALKIAALAACLFPMGLSASSIVCQASSLEGTNKIFLEEGGNIDLMPSRGFATVTKMGPNHQPVIVNVVFEDKKAVLCSNDGSGENEHCETYSSIEDVRGALGDVHIQSLILFYDTAKGLMSITGNAPFDVDGRGLEICYVR